MNLSFFVPGRPVPKGSATWIVRGGRSVPVRNDKLEAWEQRVGVYAELAVGQQEEWPRAGLYAGPVAVVLQFGFNRPKAHSRTGRYAHLLRDDAPDYPVGKTTYGDVDKLVRAVLDGLTDTLLEDDTQVVDLRATREWFPSIDREGVYVTVGTIPPQRER